MTRAIIAEQIFHKTNDFRERMIAALRAAINAAEQGENEVSIIYDNIEVTWNFDDGEFFVVG